MKKLLFKNYKKKGDSKIMAKVNQPIKELWESDKKLSDLEISKRKLGKIPPTHNVRFKGKTQKNKKRK